MASNQVSQFSHFSQGWSSGPCNLSTKCILAKQFQDLGIFKQPTMYPAVMGLTCLLLRQAPVVGSLVVAQSSSAPRMLFEQEDRGMNDHSCLENVRRNCSGRRMY